LDQGAAYDGLPGAAVGESVCAAPPVCTFLDRDGDLSRLPMPLYKEAEREDS